MELLLEVITNQVDLNHRLMRLVELLSNNTEQESTQVILDRLLNPLNEQAKQINKELHHE